MIRLHSASSINRAGIVARTFALKDIGLTSLSASRSIPFVEIGKSQPKFTVHDECRAEMRDDGATLLVTADFTVALTDQHAEQQRQLVEIKGRFELRYSRGTANAALTPDDYSMFAKINGIYHAWPYIREVVSSTFGRLGYLPLTLDSLIISPRPEETREKATK